MSGRGGKSKLRPSQDVVQRLRWDPRFDPSAYLIVHRERGGGEGEQPLTAFLDSGRVPWSRVIRVRHREGAVLWDRARRLDRVFGSGDTPEDELIEAPPEAPAVPAVDAFLVRLLPWRHDGREWRQTAPDEAAPPPPAPDTLRVVTWNVLFDRFKADKIETERRIPLLLAELREADADLIALQEVTPRFLAAVLEAPWVQRGYWCSEGPPGGTVTPHGQLLLTRAAPRGLGIHPFSMHKQALLAELPGDLVVAVIHLTSNMTPHADEVRQHQLVALRRHLERAHLAQDWLVVGDFNMDEGEADGGLLRAGSRDAWRTLHPNEPGHTFAPSANALAALMSSSGRGCRFDRVLLRSPRDRWRARAARLRATSPSATGLWASDHFALEVELARSDGLGAEPVHTTSLALVPPAALWGPIQALRRRHDDRYRRWPPHANLLYGFLPAEHFPPAVARLRELLADEAALELRLEEVESFRHRRKSTAWLAPAPAAPVIALQARVAAAFPQCREQGTKSERGFTPHLSLGQVRSRGREELELELRGLREELRAASAGRPLACALDAVHLLAREGRRPFRVLASVPLGRALPLAATLAATGLLPTPEDLARRAAARAEVEAACRAAGAVEVSVLGSEALGVVLAASDLDLAALLPPELPAADFLERLVPLLGGRVVSGRAWRRGGALGVDVQTAPADAPPPDEPAALRAAVGAQGWAAFRDALLALKAWAHLRELDRQAFGFLGGAAWAAALAWVARERGARDSAAQRGARDSAAQRGARDSAAQRGARDSAAQQGARDSAAQQGARDSAAQQGARDSAAEQGASADLLAAAFATLAELEPPARLALSDAADATPSREVPEVYGADPTRDLARSLSPATWAALQSELTAAAQLARAARAGQGAWSGLFLPAPPACPPLMWLRVEGAPEDEARGFASALARDLAARLEAEGRPARPRSTPEPTAPGGLAWAFELEEPLAAGSLAALREWLGGRAALAAGRASLVSE
ncbi:MAG: RNA repair domain-containing protein [Planctomycetota bacterium]